jgi:hypothetical protein
VREENSWLFGMVGLGVSDPNYGPFVCVAETIGDARLTNKAARDLRR